MGALNPTTIMTSRAAKSLEKMRSILGHHARVDLYQSTEEPKLGNLMVKFDSFEDAREMKEKAASAMKQAGFEIKGDMPLLTRRLNKF